MSKPQLHRDLPGYANLSDTQKITADRWDSERLASAKIMDEAENDSDPNAFETALEKVLALTAKYCEHARYYTGSCYSCDEISFICFGKKDGEFDVES